MRTVNGSQLIGVMVQPTASIVYNFNDDKEALKNKFRLYDNLFDNTRLSPGESRQFGNLEVMEEIAFGAIVHENTDLSEDEQREIANQLAKSKNCSKEDQNGGSGVTTTPLPAGSVTIDEIERVVPPPNPNGYNLGNDASCMGPSSLHLRENQMLMMEPQMKIFIFAALSLPTGTVNGFQVCTQREVRYPGEGFRFQVWRRVQAFFSVDGNTRQSQPGVFFRLIGQTVKYQPNNKTSFTYLLESKDRFSVMEGDYFGFTNYGNETLIAATPASSHDKMAAVAFYELSDFRQSLQIGEAYKFDEALQFNRYAASVLINTNTTDPTEPSIFDGPKGEVGIAGANGEKGVTGEKGEQGVKGAKGEKGADGPVGPPGDPQGEKGSKGAPGQGSVKGERGDKGEKGVDGMVKGAKGVQGEKGSRGDKGDVGAKGEKGELGSKGLKGLVGSRGDKGPYGHRPLEVVSISTCSDNFTCPVENTDEGQCKRYESFFFNASSSDIENESNTTSKLDFEIAKNGSKTDVCQCKIGFTFQNGSCVDVNECKIVNGGCEFRCVNSQGSYKCQCPPGLSLSKDGHRCNDVNECQPNPCRGKDICINRYNATDALCLGTIVKEPKAGALTDGSSNDTTTTTSTSTATSSLSSTVAPLAGEPMEEPWYWNKWVYLGLIIWLAILTLILIVCIILLIVFWKKIGKDDYDDSTMKSYELPSVIEPRLRPMPTDYGPSDIPEWAAELRQDTYISHDE